MVEGLGPQPSEMIFFLLNNRPNRTKSAYSIWYFPRISLGFRVSMPFRILVTMMVCTWRLKVQEQRLAARSRVSNGFIWVGFRVSGLGFHMALILLWIVRAPCALCFTELEEPTTIVPVVFLQNMDVYIYHPQYSPYKQPS